MNRTSARSRILAGTTLAALALGLTACGGTEGTDSAAAADAPTVAESPTPVGNDGDDTRKGKNGGGDNAFSGSAAGDQSIRAAARTAQQAVGGTVVNVDQQPSGWEVDLVAGDGTETSIDVSADGTRADGDPRTDNDDADDLRENQQVVQAASIDWATALDTARAELGTAAIDEIDLGEDDGRVTWEAGTPDGSPGTTVIIDAASGDVIGTESDD